MKSKLEFKSPIETKIILIAGYLSAGEYGCFGYCHYPDDWHSERINAAVSYLFNHELQQLVQIEQTNPPFGPFVPEEEAARLLGACLDIVSQPDAIFDDLSFACTRRTRFTHIRSIY